MELLRGRRIPARRHPPLEYPIALALAGVLVLMVLAAPRQAASSRLQSAALADQAAVHRAAAELDAGGKSIDTLRAEAQATLAGARDNAVVATWLGVAGVDPPDRALERAADGLNAAERRPVAEAAAGVRFYADRLHGVLVGGMPEKAIVLSIEDQHLTAYERGRVVLETPVTSGRPPDLATDVGPMSVLRKDSPWTMHSPWPKGSPNWYPDTQVQMVVWFTSTGEGLHDAAWQHGPYGPGSNTGPDASHGCVHVPLDAERVLYEWARVGVPVIVYPGDGSPLEAQLKQRTVDANGDPNTGARGA